MNPEHKAKWLTALRSGTIKQGRERLQKDDTYCCLGVLDNAIDKTRWNESTHRIEGIVLADDAYGLSKHLQDALAAANDGLNDIEELKNYFKKAGFSTHPDLDKITAAASSFNRKYSASFNSIANWIEENL